MRPLTQTLLATLLLAAPAALAGQAGGQNPGKKAEQPPVSAGWSIRVDEGDPAKVKVEAMPPGWHVTTGPAAVLYRDQDQASGAYEVASKLHLFPAKGGHNEAFGILIGGKDLQGANERYTYFIIRGDGTFKVKRRAGASATDVTKDWTANAAIVKGKADGPVANLLSIVVAKDKVSFRVNGTEVYAAPAGSVDTDGIAGLRINHMLSIHVESLTITKK